MQTIALPKSRKKKIEIIAEDLDQSGFHIFINVFINEKSCRFLIDTGASHSVIDKNYFIKNIGKKNLKTIQQATTGLHSSTSETLIGIVKQLSLGKVYEWEITMPIVDLSHVNKTYKELKKPSIQGILGSDILYKYKMKIDYETMKLEM